MIQLFSFIYLASAAILALYGLLGFITLWLYWRTGRDGVPLSLVGRGARGEGWLPDLPHVTVQLPIYNERYVAGRLIEAAASLDYPRDRLQIQVLDDSTDDTTAIVTGLIQHYRRKGINIQLLHRANRQGYKAGALAAGLPQASGDYLAIFDADFQPPPDFLQQTIPHFLNDKRLGLVQARWGHLNAAESPLTAAQAIALDKHFMMEQLVRDRASLFLRFNGSAGVWRRTCLEEAGGWRADTVCEDLCLSSRAVLKGWHFRFLEDVVAPAELPTTITAYKSQQARWAKGSIQCLFKYGRPFLGAADLPILARLYALLSMSAYASHLVLLLLLISEVVLVYLGYAFPSWLLLFGLVGLGQPVLFVLGQQVLYPDWPKRLRYFPALLLVGIGLAASNGRAIMQIFTGRHHPFLRTPKQGNPKSQIPIPNLQSPNPLIPALSSGQSKIPPYRLPFDGTIFLELLFALYSAAGLVLCLLRGNFGPVLFLAACLLGFGYVAWLGIGETLAGVLEWPVTKNFRLDSQSDSQEI